MSAADRLANARKREGIVARQHSPESLASLAVRYPQANTLSRDAPLASVQVNAHTTREGWPNSLSNLPYPQVCACARSRIRARPSLPHARLICVVVPPTHRPRAPASLARSPLPLHHSTLTRRSRPVPLCTRRARPHGLCTRASSSHAPSRVSPQRNQAPRNRAPTARWKQPALSHSPNPTSHPQRRTHDSQNRKSHLLPTSLNLRAMRNNDAL